MSFTAYPTIADAPALDAIAITPSATPFATPVRSIYIGGAGDITVTTFRGTSVTFTVPAGFILPLVCTHVTAATATGLRGFI